MLGAISTGIGAIGSIAQGIIGASQMRKAKKALDAYQRQELVNVMEGITISTKGADLQREELARISASSIDALQSGGVRGVVGGIGKVQQSVIKQSREIGADLDKQMKEKELLVAKDNLRIQKMIETREEADLAGLGQQLAVGQQNLFGGIVGLGSSLGQFAGMGGGGKVQERPELKTVSELTPYGISQ